MFYRRRLQAIELVEGRIDGGVGDEVVYVVVLRSEACGVGDEGGGAGEGVVDVSY